MGPALLPAPLSPASTVSCGPRFVRCRTIPVRGQVPGRGDAWSSTASAFRTQGYCCIVMLVASGPIAGDKPWGQPVAIVAPVVPIGLSAPFGHPDRPFRPARLKPARGPVRRLVGLQAAVPSAWRFQPHRCCRQPWVPCGTLRCRGLRCVLPLCRSRALVRPSAPRRSGFRLRASRGICGSPSRSAGIFEACFPTLLRASLPYLSG